MRYVVRFTEGDRRHELRTATIDGAEAIVRFLTEANVQGVTVEMDESDPDVRSEE